jgi:hypothetical protein
MSTDTTGSPLRQRMIEDMAARKLGRHAQRSHIHSCRRFAAFLGARPTRRQLTTSAASSSKPSSNHADKLAARVVTQGFPW